MDGIFKFVMAIVEKAKYCFALLPFGIFLVFAPAAWIDKFALTTFRDKYRIWIGPATFVLSCLCAIYLLHWLSAQCSRWVAALRNRRRWIQHLQNLSDGERYRLYQCHERQTDTFYAPFTDPSGHALDSKGLVHRREGNGNINDWPYVVETFVLAYMKKHPAKVFGTDSIAALERRLGILRLPRVGA